MQVGHINSISQIVNWTNGQTHKQRTTVDNTHNYMLVDEIFHISTLLTCLDKIHISSIQIPKPKENITQSKPN